MAKVQLNINQRSAKLFLNVIVLVDVKYTGK